MRKWIPWIIIVALVAALAFETTRPPPPTLGRAVQENQLAASVGSYDESNDTVLVTITRPQGVSGRIVAVLPVGTIIHNRDAGGQRLMTAAKVMLVLNAQDTSASATVEVYCLDQFAERPTTATTLALALPETPEGDVVETEETEPVRKLDECLDNKGFAHNDRQLAVWLVAGGYLDQDYSTVRDKLIAAERQTLGNEAQAGFPAFADRMREKLKNFPADAVNRAIERQRSQILGADVDAKAQEQTDKVLAQFRQSWLTLSPCIENVNDKTFFRTAPAG